MKIFLIIFVFVSFGLQAEKLQTVSPNDFLLEKYENVAIATDLEPDDVMALKIIFDEANRIYHENFNKKYPIELIIVGEGNTAIKRMRLEKMMGQFFNLPENVHVQIVEGKATTYNDFTYDGFELFTEEELKEVRVEENDQATVHILKQFVERSKCPLIIQIKPAQELFALSLEPELSGKTSVIFYGSFNLRSTLKDPNVSDCILGENKLEAMMHHFSDSFLKVAIIESYGVLGEESAVFQEYPWTNNIADLINSSSDDFLKMFRLLSSNWNRYQLESTFPEAIAAISDILYLLPTTETELIELYELLKDNFHHLAKKWDEALFRQTLELSKTALSKTPLTSSDFERGIKFMEKVQPEAGLQFTLSDIIVALAVSDKYNFFTASRVKIYCNESGFLLPVDDPGSNTLYFNRVDRKEFSNFFEMLLLN